MHHLGAAVAGPHAGEGQRRRRHRRHRRPIRRRPPASEIWGVRWSSIGLLSPQILRAAGVEGAQQAVGVAGQTEGGEPEHDGRQERTGRQDPQELGAHGQGEAGEHGAGRAAYAEHDHRGQPQEPELDGEVDVGHPARGGGQQHAAEAGHGRRQGEHRHLHAHRGDADAAGSGLAGLQGQQRPARARHPQVVHPGARQGDEHGQDPDHDRMVSEVDGAEGGRGQHPAAAALVRHGIELEHQLVGHEGHRHGRQGQGEAPSRRAGSATITPRPVATAVPAARAAAKGQPRLAAEAAAKAAAVTKVAGPG